MQYKSDFKRLFLYVALLVCIPAKGQVSFSHSGGFYQEPFALSLSASEGLTIHYTTDGATPTILSALYRQPLVLSPELYSTRNIFLMQNAPDEDWNPPSEVHHAIVLRAAAFDDRGLQVGPISTHTYIVTNLLGHTPQLPAVSIALDYEMLFDIDSGIFNPNGWNPDNEYYSGNFNQHGREWERLASVEFYELDNTGFAQTLGVRVHGGKTRRYMQKPLKLYARKEYGEKKIQCPLFDELPYDSFKRLVLKPFRAAWTSAGIQDLLAQKIASPLQFVSLASRPVTLFINGEYWGIYYLQEAPDERLIEQLDDVDADDVNIIGAWDGLVENGDGTRFLQLMQWLETADLSDTLQYQHLCTLIDIDDFIDYQLFEAFIANNDWPANNMRCYQHDHSLWRWIFYDGDAGFHSRDLDMSDLMTYQGDDTWPSRREATLCFRKLLESALFVERFGNRLHKLAATVFNYNTTYPLFKGIEATVEPEIRYQSQRFGMPSSIVQWRRAMSNIDNFLRRRPDIFVKQMENLIHVPANSSQQFCIFPNPSHDIVNIQASSSVPGWVQCCIYDSMGRLVMNVPLFVIPQTNVTQLALSSLHAGIYTLHLSNSDTTYQLVVY